MKAKFKKTKAADGLPLTPGEIYVVLDLKTGKKPLELKKIKVKNDLGEECWYSANKFELIAEAVADLKQPTAAGAGQGAAQSATPDGAQMITEINITAGLTRQAIEEAGASSVKGIMDGIGFHYGA